MTVSLRRSGIGLHARRGGETRAAALRGQGEGGQLAAQAGSEGVGKAGDPSLVLLFRIQRGWSLLPIIPLATAEDAHGAANTRTESMLCVYRLK